MASALPEFTVRPSALAGHTHAVHGIGLIDAGDQTSASGRGPVQALRGEVITVNPGEVHDGVPMQGKKRQWRMLNLESSLWNQERPAPEWTLPVLRDARLAALLEAAWPHVSGGDFAATHWLVSFALLSLGD